MKSNQLKLIWKASGYLDAQLIKIYLESFGIKAYTFEESVGVSYGLTSGPLGEVEIYVANADEENAQMYLDDFLSKKEMD